MKKIIRLAFICLVCLTSHNIFAQAKKAEAPIVLNHIAVYVHDLEQSTAFYKDVLELQEIPEPFHDGRHTWFTLGAAGQLHLIQGEGKNLTIDKNNHLCFSVLSVADFIKKLDQHQVEYTNWPGTAKAPTVRVDGVKQVYFQDPDGHWIEVNDDRPNRKTKNRK
ncbi:VOC family protein [Pontibacter sp. CAU 1760]